LTWEEAPEEEMARVGGSERGEGKLIKVAYKQAATKAVMELWINKYGTYVTSQKR